MKEMNYEEIIMGLIVNGGNARSKSMEAIAAAKEGEIEEAKKLLEEASDYLGKAHEAQTQLIQTEAGGTKIELSILMIHAQDHLMNAMTVKDLAGEFIDMYEKISK
jgi:PTS system cellobiose-specific IIA component